MKTIEQIILSIFGLDDMSVLDTFVRQCEGLVKHGYITQEQYQKIYDEIGSNKK
jgi:hypothetical protein